MGHYLKVDRERFVSDEGELRYIFLSAVVASN